MISRTKIIFLDVDPGDFILASRAARYQLARTDGGKSSILVYGEDRHTYGEAHDDKAKRFYVKENKASITVRPC